MIRRRHIIIVLALVAGTAHAFVVPPIAPSSANAASSLNLVPLDAVEALVSSSSLSLCTNNVAVPTPLLELWNNYNVVLEAHPLYTKCATSFVGFTIGDLIAQKLVEQSDSIDWPRVARLASFGVFIHGTSGHYFYSLLDSHFPGTSGGTVATKVLIDQICWSPVFTTIFFGYNLLLEEGKTIKDFSSKLQADLFTGVRGSWTFWGPAHVINFALVPPSQRLLYINGLQVIYNIFLSFLGNKEVEDGEGDTAT